MTWCRPTSSPPGGPIARDRLWFFGAGRIVDRVEARQTTTTNIPYTLEEAERRYEGKLTFSLKPEPHGPRQLHLSQSRSDQHVLVHHPRSAQPLQPIPAGRSALGQLHRGAVREPVRGGDRREPQPEVRQQRRFDHGQHRRHAGDRPGEKLAVLVADVLRRLRAGRGAQQRERGAQGDLVRVDAADRLAQRRVRLRHVQRCRLAENHQSGSDYRILGTTSIIRGSEVYPSWTPGSSTVIQWNPIDAASLGTAFRTHSLFVNDQWRLNDRLTVNLGLRWDKNDGTDSAGNAVANDSGLSPRLALTFDPTGTSTWTAERQLRDLHRRPGQQRRRQRLEWRRVVDVPVRVSRPADQHRPQRADRDPDSNRPGAADAVGLVQRQRRDDPAGRRCGHSRRERAGLATRCSRRACRR